MDHPSTFETLLRRQHDQFRARQRAIGWDRLSGSSWPASIPLADETDTVEPAAP